MTRTEEEIELAARILAQGKPHDEGLDGWYACQWPEQSPEFMETNKSYFLGDGCRGCLISVAAANSVRRPLITVAMSYANGITFYDDDALEVTRRAIRYTSSEQERMSRHSAEVVAS